MRKLLLLLIFAVSTFIAKAQNHGAIKAIILDSVTHQPVQLATVSVLKLSDTSLISYTVTDKNGAFTLHNLKQETSQLLISHVGYQGVRMKIDFKKGETVDLGKVYLSVKMLKEVVVKGERVPVIIKKDTIEFDATAFKTRPNAMVIDLLKKLPGVQINQDGISVNGKPVSKIRVNGKDFFVGNMAIGINNLPAEIIGKVQVYDDRDDDPDHLQPDYKVNKIINLKFKKDILKGLLTSLGGGAGSQGRYAGAGFAAKFTDQLQVSGRFNVDNLSGTTIFSGNYGGFSSANWGNTALSKQTSGDFDITKDISKKLKVHIEYRANDQVTDNNTSNKTLRNIGDTLFTSISDNLSHSHTNRQNFHAETEWKPDSNTIVKFQPDMEYDYRTNRSAGTGTNFNNFIPLLNTTLSSDNGRNTEFSYSHNFSYYRKLNKKGVSISFGNSIGYHPTNSVDFNDNDLMSYVAGFPSDTLRRSARNINKITSQVLSGNLHYPLSKKFSVDMSAIALHELDKGELLTYDQDLKTGLYTIFLQSQSNNLTRDLFGESLNPTLTYNITPDIYLKGGVNVLTQQIGNHFNSYTPDLNQNFFYAFPTGEVHVKQFTLGYSESVQQPSINNLQPITIVYDPLHTFVGNPFLKPSYVHNIVGNYQKNDYQSGLNFFINPGVAIETNTIINVQTVNAEGATITSPVNGKGRTTGFLRSQINKQFKKRGKWQLGIGAGLSANTSHNYFIVNGQQGYQNIRQFTLSPNMYIDWDNVLTLSPSYRFTYSHTDYPDNTYSTHVAALRADVNLPEHFRWQADYNYRYTPFAPAGFQHSANLLNVVVTRRFLKKDKAELGLMCYDLLNQNVNQTHYVSATTISDSETQILRRYIMLSFTYHFDQFN